MAHAPFEYRDQCVSIALQREVLVALFALVVVEFDQVHVVANELQAAGQVVVVDRGEFLRMWVRRMLERIVRNQVVSPYSDGFGR